MIKGYIWCVCSQVRLDIRYRNVIALLEKSQGIPWCCWGVDFGEFVQGFPTLWGDVYATFLDVRWKVFGSSGQLLPVGGCRQAVRDRSFGWRSAPACDLDIPFNDWSKLQKMDG